MERRQLQFHALGSEVFLTLIAEPDFPFESEFADLQDKIATFERRFSRFLPDSELTRFNTRAGSDTEISGEFRALLKISKQMAKDTADQYNPFVLPALQQAGYKGSWPNPDKLAGATDYSDRAVVSSAEIHIETHSARIPSGTALDFGGIGKGYLLDELVAHLQPLGLHGYWLSLGGDIACSGYDLEDTVWAVQVQHATDLKSTIASIANTEGNPLFIATSGITKRHGDNATGSWHHIIDPKTAKPATTDILTATVTADSGTHADVYAKTIVISGSKQAETLKQSGLIAGFALQYIDKEPRIRL